MSLNAESWTAVEVAEWIAGLGSNAKEQSSPFSRYSSSFRTNNINGKLLLNLMAGDLQRYGVKNVGDQLILQDAIQALRSELDTPRVTLQSLASSLAVRCRNYRAELSLLSSGVGYGPGSHTHNQNQAHGQSQINYIPTESLSSASFLLEVAKLFIRWLTRFPFVGNPEYDGITVKLTKHCFELAMLSQRDSFADNAIEEVQYLCTKIIEICEGIIHSNDSLVIQPAAVDVITLRKRTEQDLGLTMESSYFGLHQVSSVKISSPAQQSGHLQKGDEVLQVNYQTVIGWPQTNVISLLNENPNEVILTIKRRPRHATANILAHMYLRPSNRLMGASHRSQKRHGGGRHGADKLGHSSALQPIPSSIVLPSSSRHGHTKHMPISPVPEDEHSSSSSSSSSVNSPVVLVNVNVGGNQESTTTTLTKENVQSSLVISEPVPVPMPANTEPKLDSSGTSSSPSQLPSGQSIDTLDSDPDAIKSPGLGVTSGSDSNSTSASISVSTKSPNGSSAHSRFWKLYPRPRNMIRRRATVTGASPTSTRPPVTFFDDEGSESKHRPPLINSKSAPEKIRVGLRKQGNVVSTANAGTSTDPQPNLNRQTMPPCLDIMTNFPFTSDLVQQDKSKVKPANDTISAIISESKADSSVDEIVAAPIPVVSPIKQSKHIPLESGTLLKRSTPVSTKSSPLKYEELGASGGVEIRTHPRLRKSGSPSPITPFTSSTSRKSPSPSDSSYSRQSPSPSISSSITDKDGEPTTLLKSVLHLRQSPANLLVKSNSLTSTSGSGSGTGFSSHPRWTRHPAVLDSHKMLQIGSDCSSCLKINVSEESGAEVTLASEVHSRPFAFKIEVKPKPKILGRPPSIDDKSGGIFYLAAESSSDFEIWMRFLMKPEASDSLFRSRSTVGAKELMYQKMRSSAPPLYKRSLSLGNSPAYSRRNSLSANQSPRNQTNGVKDGSNESINHNRSFVLRKNNLMRSSKLVGNSTPNVQASGLSSSPTSSTASTPVTHSYSLIGTSKPYQSINTTPRKSNSESVKSEWFNSPTTPPSKSPKRFFASTPTGFSYKSPYAASTSSTPSPSTKTASGTSQIPSVGDSGGRNVSGGSSSTSTSTTSSSNISSITIRSVARKSDSELNSPIANTPASPISPDSEDVFSPRMKSHSTNITGKPTLPTMGVNMALAKQSGSPLASPKKMVAAVTSTSSLSSPTRFPSTTSKSSFKFSPGKQSTSSSSSSSDVFIKPETSHESRRQRRVVNCPSCGGSTSSFSKEKNLPVRDMWTQTLDDELETSGQGQSLHPIPVSPNLELLRHLINEEEGSRV